MVCCCIEVVVSSCHFLGSELSAFVLDRNDIFDCARIHVPVCVWLFIDVILIICSIFGWFIILAVDRMNASGSPVIIIHDVMITLMVSSSSRACSPPIYTDATDSTVGDGSSLIPFIHVGLEQLIRCSITIIVVNTSIITTI